MTRAIRAGLTFKIFHKSHLDPVTKKPRNGRTGASEYRLNRDRKWGGCWGQPLIPMEKKRSRALGVLPRSTYESFLLGPNGGGR